jgi:hypothetical protein
LAQLAQAIRERCGRWLQYSQRAGILTCAADQVLASAAELGKQAAILRGDVDGFLARIRAA